MGKSLLAIVLSGMLAMAAERVGTVEEAVRKLGSGTMVEVRRAEKGSKKLRGRLGAITEEGFELQGEGTVRLAYGEVKSIRVKEPNGRRGLYVLAGVGIGLGVVFLIAAMSTGRVD
jgi:hypothetical protein